MEECGKFLPAVAGGAKGSRHGRQVRFPGRDIIHLPALDHTEAATSCRVLELDEVHETILGRIANPSCLAAATGLLSSKAGRAVFSSHKLIND